jgi:hypothetical protein
MTPEERDRLVTLKKAKKKLIKKQVAAEELDVSVRHVRRLLVRLKEEGDRSVIHGLKGKPSHRRIEDTIEKQAVEILSAEVYRGFGPTLASEYLSKKHGIEASKETVRQWMMRAQLWRGKKEKTPQMHVWRPRRSRWGEMVQWDTSEHDWLEGRGEKLYLIAMIDDATSRLWAQFAEHDSTAENMLLLWSYVEKFGRPQLFYTDKAGLFRTAEKRRRDEPGVDKDPMEMPPTQIGRALRELGIAWTAAHSPQAKGRIERSFATAQDRLVKGLRKAEATTLEQANRYLQEEYLVWWEQAMTVEPAHSDNAHRPLEKSHSLAASLSRVEARQIRNDYTLRLEGQLYQVERKSIVTGLRGASVRVEQRLDGSVAVRFGDRYLAVSLVQGPPLPSHARPNKTAAAQPKPARVGKSGWMKGFWEKPAPSLGKALAISNATS